VSRTLSFDAAKLARELVVDHIMSTLRSMKHMPCTLFATDVMITEQIPFIQLLFTRARDGCICAYASPDGEMFIMFMIHHSPLGVLPRDRQRRPARYTFTAAIGRELFRQ
jgi:hypothetical protein